MSTSDPQSPQAQTIPVPEHLAGMAAPGQEDVLNEFLAELQGQNAAIAAAEQRVAGQQGEQPPASSEPERLLAGKFKNAEELERSYLELQSLMGQRQAETPATPPPPPTREQSVERYGESIVAAAEEAGLDLHSWDQAVRAGQDTAEQRQKLAQRTGIPEALIAQYEQAFRPQSPAPSEPAAGAMSDADVAEVKASIGGDAEFQRISQWAAANLSREELADYNAAVGSGKAAARFALQSLKARAATQPQQRAEPELIGGGRAAAPETFANQQEALAAYRKTDERGRRLVDTSPKYRKWYEETVARSDY